MGDPEEEKGQQQQLRREFGGDHEKNIKEQQEDDDETSSQVPLMALNHVSRLCKSVQASVDFYVNVLGFVLINRPPSLDFDGAWLFNYGVGIHLVHKKDGGQIPDALPDRLDPMDNHISFQVHASLFLLICA